MDKLLLVFGGSSPENEISVLTALKVYNALKESGNTPLVMYLDLNNNFYSGNSLLEVKNYYNKQGFFKALIETKKEKYYLKFNHRKYEFDYAYILGHGINIEDGTLSSYFQIRNIPYLYDDLDNVSLFQDKIKSKYVFKALNVPTIPFKVLYRYQNEDKFNPPLIIKPSRLGSSIGINLITNKKDFKLALQEAFLYEEKVLIEKAILQKEEYNIALIGYQGKIIVSEIEKVNDRKEVLSFLDKYDYSSNNSKRIINPPLDDKTKDKIIKYSQLVFSRFNLCGVYRFDYIIDKKDDGIYLNEINSLPGSLAYYLFETKGLKLIDLVILDITLKKKKLLERSKMKKDYQIGFIKDIDLDKIKK